MKNICIALALSISTIVLVFNTTNVYAANNTGGNNIETVVENELDIEDFNYIQNKYLCQAIDGTLTFIRMLLASIPGNPYLHIIEKLFFKNNLYRSEFFLLICE